MQPGERIEIIKRIATRLAADDWADIDLVLEQFGFETEWRWEGDAKSYVVHCIKNNSDGKLAALDHYLMGHSRPDEEPWQDGRFRLFLSHLAQHKATAHALKSHLRFYGMDAFVAHEDIQPGKEWQLVIESALHSCDALVGLLHTGFRESDWCDQEVGFALGRGVPVVPLHFDLYPYGFFGSVSSWTLAETMAWECSCGSTVRDVCWRNTAAVIPSVSTWSTPSVPRRVTAPWRSNQATATSTAASCEASTSARTNGSGDTAHRTDTDFGGENVASNPRADESPKRRPSGAPVSG